MGEKFLYILTPLGDCERESVNSCVCNLNSGHVLDEEDFEDLKPGEVRSGILSLFGDLSQHRVIAENRCKRNA